MGERVISSVTVWPATTVTLHGHAGVLDREGGGRGGHLGAEGKRSAGADRDPEARRIVAFHDHILAVSPGIFDQDEIVLGEDCGEGVHRGLDGGVSLAPVLRHGQDGVQELVGSDVGG